jgi:drug/metabolite transporter (DMT)-like permease
LNWALKSIPAARAAVIFSLFPLLTMMLAVAIRRERMTWPKSVGVGLAVTGVAIAIGEQALTGRTSTWAGDLAAFGAAACGAVCSVMYGPYVRRYPPLTVGAFAMASAALALLAAVYLTGKPVFAFPFSPPGFAAVVFIGVASGLGYSALLWALAHTTPTRVTVFQTLAPLTATGLGLALLGEAVSMPFLIGLCVVVLGLFVAQVPATVTEPTDL